MAFSSLLFGGLSLWHARQGSQEGVQGSGLDAISNFSSQVNYYVDWHRLLLYRLAAFLHSIDPRTFAWLISTLCLLVLLAYSTNPSDAGFRSYLTELSLHQHLRQIRSESPTSQAGLSEEQLEGATRSEAEKIASPHILTFSNRISVSLRTPRYEKRDYGLFSTVTVPATTLTKVGCSHRQANAATSTRYIGAFGKWWLLGSFQSTSGEKSKRCNKSNVHAASSSWGVLAMKAGDSNEEEEEVGEKNDDSEKVSNSKKAIVNGANHSKHQLSVQGSDATQTHGSRPSGRRKKQAHKPRPAQPLPGGEASAADRRPSEEAGHTNEALPATSVTDHTVFIPSQGIVQEPQPSPTATTGLSASANTSETSGNAAAAAILEVQTQLDQVRLASETSRKQLQSQLEELRSRKRDEDATRLDVKGRMKTLDESKRQAEWTKREAEKRLKAANGLKEAIGNRINAKIQEMNNFSARESAHELKVQESSRRKTSKIQEMRDEIEQKGSERIEAEDAIEQLRLKLERLQQRLLEEEANLEAARELAAERDAALVAQRNYHPAPTSSPPHHNIYPLLSGPGEMPDQSLVDMQIHHGTGLGPTSHLPGWNANNDAYQDVSNTSSTLQFPMTSDGTKGEADFDDTFDPTISAIPKGEHTRFAPFYFDQTSFHNSFVAPQAVQTPVSVFSDGSNMPISPFTSDLLPSNLFQNADDDERHVGVMPGSRSERVEAALNRFGLDSSDTSDVEGNMESAVDGEMEATAKRFAEDNDPAELANENNRKSTARSWWGGRSRNGSKDRSISNGGIIIDPSIPSPGLDSQPQPEGGKRRSLSIFPKLSLNPGAKSFRGTSKRSDLESKDSAALNFTDNESDAATMQAMWNTSTGQVPTRQDFESMKRAFQTNNLVAPQEDEDQGRRSWSAFDTWQQQQQQQNQLPLSAAGTGAVTTANGIGSNRPPARFPSQFNPMYLHNQRASSDSLAQRHRMLASQATDSSRKTDWLDEAFLPLHKSQSIDAHSSSTNSSSSANASIPSRSQRIGKPSRFAFWNSNSSNAAAASSSSTGGLEEGSGDGGDALAAAAASSSSTASTPVMNGSSSSSAGASQPSKRSSFRWSRRQDSTSDALTTIDKSKDQD